jgi:hypothetical protein
MITRSRCAFTLTCLVLTAISTIAFASYKELESPHLWFGKDFSKDDYKQLDAVLTRSDCKFIGGAELNSFSSLRYGGDTVALNKFIEALSLCPKLKVHVMFYRPTGAVEADWMVTQRAPAQEVEVRVNLASEHIKIENLYLPPVKAEKASE